jgi:citrate synthase
VTRPDDDNEGGEWTYPVLPGHRRPDVVDIRKLYGQSGMFTYDPGFTSTAACQSAITYIDGEQGILLHRGYPIDQLAEHSSFMEVRYPPAARRLPSADARHFYLHHHRAHTMLHEQLSTFYRGFRRDATRWRSCAAWSARFGLLSRQHRHHRSRSSG